MEKPRLITNARIKYLPQGYRVMVEAARLRARLADSLVLSELLQITQWV